MECGGGRGRQGARCESREGGGGGDLGDWGRGRDGGVVVCGLDGYRATTVLLVSFVPGRAVRRAEAPAHAQHETSGQASRSPKSYESGWTWDGPKNRSSCRAVGLQAVWTSIVAVRDRGFPGPHFLRTRELHAQS